MLNINILLPNARSVFNFFTVTKVFFLALISPEPAVDYNQTCMDWLLGYAKETIRFS